MVSSGTFECCPWEEPMAVPADCAANKKRRAEWLNALGTNHCFYSTFEGFNPNARVSSAGEEGEENNPARLCYGLVVDADSEVSDDTFQSMLDRWETHRDYLPNYVQRTPSKGHFRLVWLFERPVRLVSGEHTTAWLNYVLKKPMKHLRQVQGLDEPAFLKSTQYYLQTHEWAKMDGVEPIPYVVAAGWLVDTKFDFTTISRHSIPIPEVKKLLEAKFPRFNAEWTGDFAEGAQGPSFWVEGSVSPMSAIVRETGMQTFAAHAIKGFFPWSELLGRDAVENYRQEATAAAAENIFFDGQTYYKRAMDRTRWQAAKSFEIGIDLKVAGLSSKAPRGETSSPLEATLQFIHNHNRISGAGPFIYRPQGVFNYQGDLVLNMCHRLACTPAPDGPEAVWGPTGGFPFFSRWMDGFFMPGERDQLQVWLTWAKIAYESALNLNPVPGHAMVIAGQANAGKSLLGREVFGKRMMGGFFDAEKFLTKDSNFNSELYYHGVWCVDDSSSTEGSKFNARRFSEGLKRMVANQQFACNTKFQKDQMIEWTGRVGVTLNDDALSLKKLPNMGGSVADKFILLRAASNRTDGFAFPADRQYTQRVLDTEVPIFARWLISHYQPPAELLVDTRFGMCSFQEATLKDASNRNTDAEAFYEMIVLYCRDKGVNEMSGSSSHILTQLRTHPDTKELIDTTGASATEVTDLLKILRERNRVTLTETVDAFDVTHYTLCLSHTDLKKP